MNPMSPNPTLHPVRKDSWDEKEDHEGHFEKVYTLYYRKIYGICRRYSPSPDEAQDLTHDVFMRYFLNFRSFRHDSCPSTWMYRVAINLGIQRWRKERIRNLEEKELEAIPAETADVELTLLDRIALDRILERYPERTRKILILHHIERMTQIEIGKLLGISRTTVIRDLVHVQRTWHRIPKRVFRAGRRAMAPSVFSP